MKFLQKFTFLIIFLGMILVCIGCGSEAKISFEENPIYVVVDHEFVLNPIVKEEGQNVIFSFDENVFVQIDNNTFKALYGGEYQITASLENDSEATVELTVKVTNDHVYDQQVIHAKYFASKATCEEKAKFYYSCICGAKGTETFDNGEALGHTFDQKVIESKYADTENPYKYYYSCICGEIGEEYFFNIEPKETAVTLADDDIANLEIGKEYEYKGIKFVVGLNAFATIKEAITYATETVYIAAGEYTTPVVVNKSNLKILGNNAGVNPNIANRDDESVLTNKLSLEQDVNNITISGLYFTDKGQFKCSTKGGNDNVVFEYNVFDNDITLVSGYPNGAELMFNPYKGSFNKNLTVRNNRFLSTGGKTYHLFLTNIENLTVYGNYFEGTYAQVYADSIMFDDTEDYGAIGDIIIENNEFYNICQYGIIFWNYHDMNLKIIGNKFTNCGVDGADDGYLRGVVSLIAAKDTLTKATVLIEKNEMENVDTCIRIQHENIPAEKIEVIVKDNIFKSWAEKHPITNNDLGEGTVINAEKNYFGQAVTDDNFKGVSSWANKYDNIDDVPKYERGDLVYVTSLAITNKVDKLPAYSEYKVKFSYEPSNATYTKVVFKSSDESVATVSDSGMIKVLGSGKATIYAYCVFDQTIVDSFEFEVQERDMINVTYPGNGVLDIEETVQIDAILQGASSNTIEYSSSDESIATVNSNGLVTAVGEGLVIITIKSGDLVTEVGFTVLDDSKEYSALMKLLIENNSGTLFYDVINYIGYEEGFESVAHKIYSSANAYWFGEMPEITKNMLPTDRANYSGQLMTSVEYIVVHDTGAANPAASAEANSGWCTNEGNTGTSWHYTTGNDGIYQQLEDNVVAWHAGDWSQKNPAKFKWNDTGVKYNGARPTVTVGDDGFFYIDGIKSLVEAPKKEDGSLEKNINKVGLICVKGENGNYMIPTTWISDESGYPVCAYGGNSNGIGIESCVNSGSDLWLTWHYTAKLAAQLAIKHNLYSDRVVFHNNFTNKTCPNTMITNDLVDEFYELVNVEYEIAKNYSDYEIKFTSHNLDIMDNTGRIINAPDYTTNVTYTITLTKDGVSEEVTLNVLVPGRFGLK